MPKGFKLRVDRRTQRTQRLLQDALRTLLAQRPFDEIAVLDITEKADVNRATFYDHYTDKFDLFNAVIAADFRELLERRNVCFDETCSSGLAAIVLAVGDYLEQIHRDKPTCSQHPATASLIDAAITLAVRQVVVDGMQNKGIAAPVPPEVFASMLSGAIYGAVKQWLSARDWHMDEEGLRTLIPLMPVRLPEHLQPELNRPGR